MALTEEQRIKTVLFLGYPATSIMPGSTDYSRGLMARLITLSPTAEAMIVALLTDIEEVKGKLKASSSRMLVKKVGDIELNTEESGGLRKEHGRLLRELSSILSIPNLNSGSMINLSI